MIRSEFWQGKKVLVTGCSGFKGAWLSTWLVQLGAKVHGYALTPPTTPSMFDLLKLNEKIKFCVGDIRDYAQFAQYLQESEAEIVFHLAAQPLVLYSYDNPIETYHTNVLGTVNIFEAIRHNKTVKAVVNITSDKCYENKEWLWGYRENEAMGGYDPYSNSKGCAELVTSCYQNSYFNIKDYGSKHNTLLASARAGNVIGGGDWAADRLIPDFMKAFMARKVAAIRNPAAIRPWQHVLEPLSGYLLLAQHLYAGDVAAASAWNFGPHLSDCKTVASIASRLCEFWGEDAKCSAEQLEPQVLGDDKQNANGGSTPHEANYLKLDWTKAHSLLRWQPHWTLDEALAQTIAWYKAYSQHADLWRMSIAQINEYME